MRRHPGMSMRLLRALLDGVRVEWNPSRGGWVDGDGRVYTDLEVAQLRKKGLARVTANVLTLTDRGRVEAVKWPRTRE